MLLSVCTHEAAIDSRQTGVDWANFCREECATYTSRNPVQIGGFDAMVRPLLSKLTKRNTSIASIIAVIGMKATGSLVEQNVHQGDAS